MNKKHISIFSITVITLGVVFYLSSSCGNTLKDQLTEDSQNEKKIEEEFLTYFTEEIISFYNQFSTKAKNLHEKTLELIENSNDNITLNLASVQNQLKDVFFYWQYGQTFHIGATEEIHPINNNSYEQLVYNLYQPISSNLIFRQITNTNTITKTTYQQLANFGKGLPSLFFLTFDETNFLFKNITNETLTATNYKLYLSFITSDIVDIASTIKERWEDYYQDVFLLAGNGSKVYLNTDDALIKIVGDWISSLEDIYLITLESVLLYDQAGIYNSNDLQIGTKRFLKEDMAESFRGFVNAYKPSLIKNGGKYSLPVPLRQIMTDRELDTHVFFVDGKISDIFNLMEDISPIYHSDDFERQYSLFGELYENLFELHRFLKVELFNELFSSGVVPNSDND